MKLRPLHTLTLSSKSTPTAYQLEWDKRNKALTIKNLCILMSLAAAAAIVLTVTVSTIFIPSVNGSLNLDGVLQRAGIPVLAILFLLAVSAFVNRHIRTARWILGERPSDDFTSRTAKPIDFTVEQVGENDWEYTVGDYVFNVHRSFFSDSHGRGRTERGYRIAERSHRIAHTFFADFLRGNDSDQSAIVDRISFQLEDHTDYFKATL